MTGDLTQPPINDLILTIKSRGGRGKPREKAATEPGGEFWRPDSTRRCYVVMLNVTGACRPGSGDLSYFQAGGVLQGEHTLLKS